MHGNSVVWMSGGHPQSMHVDAGLCATLEPRCVQACARWEDAIREGGLSRILTMQEYVRLTAAMMVMPSCVQELLQGVLAHENVGFLYESLEYDLVRLETALAEYEHDRHMRALAVCMGSHARLGGTSALVSLPDDLIKSIARRVFY